MQPHNMGRATRPERGGRMLDAATLLAYYPMQTKTVTYAFLMMAASSLSLNLPSSPRFKLGKE